jgi:hypothetical protein
MKNLLSIASTLFIGSVLTLSACGKDKKPATAEPTKAEPAATDPAKGDTAKPATEPKADDKKADDKGGGGGW